MNRYTQIRKRNDAIYHAGMVFLLGLAAFVSACFVALT